MLVCICANMCVSDRKRSDSDSDSGSSTADIIPQSTTCFSLSLRPSSFLWRSPVPRPGQTRVRLSDSDHSAVSIFLKRFHLSPQFSLLLLSAARGYTGLQGRAAACDARLDDSH